MRLKRISPTWPPTPAKGAPPGTNGIEAAADYIAKTFQAAGLKPAAGADGYFQNFSIGGHPSLGKNQELAVHGPDGKTIRPEGKGEFSPMAIGVSATLREDSPGLRRVWNHRQGRRRKLDYDDYAEIDVKGKAVLIIRREPREDDASSPFGGKSEPATRPSSTRRPTPSSTARSAVLLVNDLTAIGEVRTSC